MPAEPGLNKQAIAESDTEIPHDAVLAALDAVVKSAAFGKSERPARFLRHLVETALSGEPQLLKETVLGTDVFDRPATWDPRLDPVVRQEAARLRKRLTKYYESAGAQAEIRIELPTGGYVPSFRRTTVETQPAKTSQVDPVSVPKRRVWPYAATAALCVTASVLTSLAFLRHESPTSIAVLPFSNLTADPANQYFSDGLTDEITDSLARLKTLRVIARSSAVQFKGKPVDLREVGRLLNVANVLEGSIERSGDRIKVIAHLERVADGSLRWSNTYERQVSDLFAVQSELAAGIAESLKAAASVPAAKHTPTPEAHDLVMKARYDLQQMTPDALTHAEEELSRAVDLDPEYAAAYLGLGVVQFNRAAAKGSLSQTEGERKRAEQWFHKALELDPDLPSAHAMLAALAMQCDWDWGRAERELRMAVSGSPSATAEGYYAFLLVFRGRFGEAESHIRRMVDLDPFSTATLKKHHLARNLEGRFA
jgi:TolB-like protein